MLEDILKLFFATVLAVVVFMFVLQGFVRWKTSKLKGKEIPFFERNVILYFFSPQCGICIKMNPVIEELSKEVRVRKIDVSSEEGLNVAKKLGILGTPTVLVVKEGRVKKAFVGFQSKEAILKEFQS